MARSTPYTAGLMVIDLVCTLLTGGVYLIFVLFREMYKRN